MDLNNRENSLKFWQLTRNKMFMVPAWWHYTEYDTFMYDIMCYDTVRMNSYQSVIQKTVKGKRIVDIGAGATLPLTLMCMESGANFVYAIEGNQNAANKAADIIKEKHLSHKIRIIPGHSFESELPEKIDICLSELIGSIGNAEGVVSILKDAKRFLKGDGIMIPQRCVTKIVPISLPDNIYSDGFIEDVVAYYIQSAYNKAGRKFEFSRFEFYNFPESNMIAEPQIFEDIRFEKEMFPEFTSSLSFIIQSDCKFEGFLLWINLYIDSETMIDSWCGSSWTPIYIPHKTCFFLKERDIMNVECIAKLGKNSINPDYIFNGIIYRNRDEVYNFSIHSKASFDS